eukprot:scaffold6764_cov66-Phaeocystis_antarctica.AAC.1
MNYCYYVLRTPHYFLLTHYYTTHYPPLAHCLLRAAYSSLLPAHKLLHYSRPTTRTLLATGVPHHRVAKQVLLAALVHPCYRDRSFDLRAKP